VIMFEWWNRRYKTHISDKEFLFSIATGLLFLALSITFTYFATIYANTKASQPVTDIILDNIPVLDVDGIFIYGPLIFITLVGLYALVFRFHKIPFTLSAIAVFVFIRAIFTTLTHIAPSPDQIDVSVSNAFFSVFTTGNDLFFSGHTGLPFLLALVFWDEKYLRILCLAASVFFGAVVLLGHLHYTIDVVSAFFITYAIFKISEKLFKKEKEFCRQII